MKDPIMTQERETWRDIGTAPLGKLVLAWNPTWRRPWPARRIDDNDTVWVDTGDSAGWPASATHWMPLRLPMGRAR